jgi:hypothetical protein
MRIAQVQANVAAMVTVVQQSTSCYLVMSVPNGEYPIEWKGAADYNEIIALNNALSATYSSGDHYLDIRAAIVALYNRNNPADVLDSNNDVWPYSLWAGDVSGLLTAPVLSLTTCSFSTSPVLGGGSVISANAELIQITGGTNGAYACVRGYLHRCRSVASGTEPGERAESEVHQWLRSSGRRSVRLAAGERA